MHLFYDAVEGETKSEQKMHEQNIECMRNMICSIVEMIKQQTKTKKLMAIRKFGRPSNIDAIHSTIENTLESNEMIFNFICRLCSHQYKYVPKILTFILIIMSRKKKIENESAICLGNQ